MDIMGPVFQGGRTIVIIVIAAASVTACGGESRVQFGLHENEDVLRPLLTITATAGDWTLVLTGDEIGSPDMPSHTREFETPGSGTLRVEAVLARPGEEPLASGAIELDIRDDWSWGVGIHLTSHNPTDMCFGCIGYRAFAVPEDLLPEQNDSLFLVWGGNSISEPVVY